MHVTTTRECRGTIASLSIERFAKENNHFWEPVYYMHVLLMVQVVCKRIYSAVQNTEP